MCRRKLRAGSGNSPAWTDEIFPDISRRKNADGRCKTGSTRNVSTMPPAPSSPFSAVPGRGASVNPPNRFERLHLEPDPDCPPDEQPHPQTQFFYDSTET